MILLTAVYAIFSMNDRLHGTSLAQPMAAGQFSKASAGCAGGFACGSEIVPAEAGLSSERENNPFLLLLSLRDEWAAGIRGNLRRTRRIDSEQPHVWGPVDCHQTLHRDRLGRSEQRLC